MSNFRFADNIVLLSHDLQELLEMAEELSVKSKKVGLTMNIVKTKIMTNIRGGGKSFECFDKG